MKKSVIIGVSFGITSGIITALGLMVGMAFATNSKILVIGSLLTIAVADSLSDSLGIHISEEADKSTTTRGVWESTIATFLAKFLFTMTFIIPIYFLNLKFAVLVNIIWGLIVLCFLSFFVAKESREKPFDAIFEHLFIAVIVLVATYFIGGFISTSFV